MYKFYEKNGYKVMHFIFYSLSEFIDFLKNNNVCSNVFSDPSSISGSYDFTQTRSLDEAMDLCLYGYHDNFNKLIQLKLQLEKYVKMSSKKNKQYNDYIGYVPDVKAYLEGNPLSMLNKVSARRKKLDIYLNTSFYGSTSSESIYNRGAIVLTLVEILESLGYSVDLHIFEMSTVDSQMHFSEFILKRENERLNPQKLYFPLCHPSWIRRLNFRLIEETKDATNYGWASGYGKPSNISTIRQIIEPNKNDIIIPTIDELNIYGRDLTEDTNNLFEYINRSSEKDFVLERIKKLERTRN